MPNIMEISGLLSGRMGRLNGKLGRLGNARPGLMDLRNALGKGKKVKSRKISSKPSQKAFRKLPGPNAQRALEIAEKLFAEGKKPLAIAWARQAENKAVAEGNSAVRHRATQLIKIVRGEAAAKLMAGFGDVDGIVMGRMMGLW